MLAGAAAAAEACTAAEEGYAGYSGRNWANHVSAWMCGRHAQENWSEEGGIAMRRGAS